MFATYWTIAVVVLFSGITGCARSQSASEARAQEIARLRADRAQEIERHQAEWQAIQARKEQQRQKDAQESTARLDAAFAPLDARINAWKELRDKAVQDSKDAMTAWQTSTGCTSTEISAVIEKIAALEPFVVVEIGGDASHISGTAASQCHPGLSFAFADEALKRGCLDEADGVYRRLIEFYIGAAYSGIRDRARIGIDDVRAARAKTERRVEQ